ncbi:L domain-like protein [Trametes sanguinea]|nr:L domain-like protein [Trametes sanguinea]
MASGQPKPAWLTDELADVEEWVDWQDDDNSVDSIRSGSDLSLTQPLGSVLVRNNDLRSTSDASRSDESAGTFIVREEMPQAPLLPKTPGRGNKPAVKDFFSPLALEKMFEPPSPPQPSTSLPPQAAKATAAPPVPSRLSQVHLPPSEESQTHDAENESYRSAQSDQGNDRDNNLLQVEAANSHFTFSVPRPSPFNPAGPIPNAQSTPGPSVAARHLNPPSTDPRLRLFQFQYDTFTRDHLSAMVDSIAVNTPSGEGAPGTQGSQQSTPSGLSPVAETSFSRLRSAKRIKLSPASDFSGEKGDGAAVIMRPLSRKDYVGESRNLMEQIRKARDFSTVSTVATARSPRAEREVPERCTSKGPSPTGTVSSGKHSTYSSLGFRQQAASLMAQIRSDMKGSKRLFSGDTDISHARTEDASEASVVSADATVPSLRSRGGDIVIQSRPRQLSHSQAQMRRTSSAMNRVSSVARGKQREQAPASPHRSVARTSARNSGSDAAKDLSEDFTRMSLESSNVLAQFPAPPVRLVSASTSTAAPSPMKPSPGLLAPPSGAAPAYPSSSLRGGRNADLTRFVSSSTASGTTVTAGSTESFVKHPGPKQIMQITPNDVPALPDRVGKMVFDRVMMRWVKATALATAGISEVEEQATGEQEDMDGMDEMSGYTDDTVPDDVDNRTDDMVPTTTLDLPLERHGRDGPTDHTAEPAFDDTPPQLLAPATARPSHPPAVLATPNPPSRSASGVAPTPAPRSAMKSASITPVSALKDPSRNRLYTPANASGHRRSVSFSDGKHDGPIRGIGRNLPTPEGSRPGDDDEESPLALESRAGGGTAVLVPSARSRRIANMLDNLGDDDFADDSPSKASTSSRPPPADLEPMQPRRPSTGPGAADASAAASGRRVSSRLMSTPRGASANATFLTECSFGVAHDKLVQVITDVQPFEPYWEDLSSIDLSHRNLDSAARLKEFLPKLDSLSLNSNQLEWLSGIPGSVRTLSVASNLLTGVTSFSHLLNLENLDISRNQIDSLRQLECLRHLRELRADGNRIDSLDGLQKMDGLIKLSLQGNELREVDLHGFKWTRLEMLNLSQNRISHVAGLGSVPTLVALNLDENALPELEPEVTMSRLRILRVSGNRLQTLNATFYPNLRTLYADNNSLGTIARAYRLAKLENLSLRNQNGRGGLAISIRDVRDVKRLYLSGNPLKPGFLSEPCYNLVYLELAACRLIQLPTDFARMVPNVRVLNLNYNFLEDPSPLRGLTRLRKLTIIGSRIKGAKQLVGVLRGMSDMEMIDFRRVMNPCTLGWYLPLLVKDIPGALQPSDAAESNHGVDRPRERTRQELVWRELDAKFRRDLPDDAYVGRLAYRGLVMRACPNIRMLDGVEVERKERDKAEKLLRSVFGASAASSPSSSPDSESMGRGSARGTRAAAVAVEQS